MSAYKYKKNDILQPCNNIMQYRESRLYTFWGPEGPLALTGPLSIAICSILFFDAMHSKKCTLVTGAPLELGGRAHRAHWIRGPWILLSERSIKGSVGPNKNGTRVSFRPSNQKIDKRRQNAKIYRFAMRRAQWRTIPSAQTYFPCDLTRLKVFGPEDWRHLGFLTGVAHRINCRR